MGDGGGGASLGGSGRGGLGGVLAGVTTGDASGFWTGLGCATELGDVIGDGSAGFFSSFFGSGFLGTGFFGSSGFTSVTINGGFSTGSILACKASRYTNNNSRTSTIAAQKNALGIDIV